MNFSSFGMNFIEEKDKHAHSAADIKNVNIREAKRKTKIKISIFPM
jgi:hypothetical protein